jgi:hypothetical protein
LETPVRRLRRISVGSSETSGLGSRSDVGQPRSRESRGRGGRVLGLPRHNQSQFPRRPPTLDCGLTSANGKDASRPLGLTSTWANNPDRKILKMGRTGENLPRMGTLLRIDVLGVVRGRNQRPIDGRAPWSPRSATDRWIVPSSRSPIGNGCPILLQGDTRNPKSVVPLYRSILNLLAWTVTGYF